jgi:aspartate 1-decarboxylase
MRRIMLKSKIHNAVVTETELAYEGSITIDGDILREVDIIEFERVQVVNLNNGARFETYVIEGQAGEGTICLNGPAARMGERGDKVHVLSYTTLASDELKGYKPTVVVLDENNRIAIKK